MSDPVPSFANDIAPIFFKYRGEMAWRLDLASYADVKANAQIIIGQISTQGMPPPPFQPFPQSFIDQFQAWVDAGCPDN